MGMLVDTMKKNAITYKKPAYLVSVRVDINTVQEKFYNALLYIAEKYLGKEPDKKIFMVSLVELKKLLSISSKNQYYIDNILDLRNKEIEYLFEDSKYEMQGFVRLVSDIYKIREKKTDELSFGFELPEKLRLSLLNKSGEIYVMLNLVIVRGLRSRYAIRLYELTERYKNVEIPKMSLDEFKGRMNLKKEQYKDIKDLKKRVIDKAIKEINESQTLDFLISYELFKTGRKYTHIKFHIKPKPQKMKLEQQKTKIIEQEVEQNPDLQELLLLLPSELRNTRVTQTLLGALEQKGKEYIQKQIEYCLSVKEKSKIKNFAGYLKKAIEQDYAGVEIIEITEPKKEEKLDNYIGKWLVKDSIGYCIVEITKEKEKINVVVEEKGTGVKKLFKFKDLETLRSYMY